MSIYLKMMSQIWAIYEWIEVYFFDPQKPNFSNVQLQPFHMNHTGTYGLKIIMVSFQTRSSIHCSSMQIFKLTDRGQIDSTFSICMVVYAKGMKPRLFLASSPYLDHTPCLTRASLDIPGLEILHMRQMDPNLLTYKFSV